MTVGSVLYPSNPTCMTDATFLDTQITLLDAAAKINGSSALLPKTVNEVLLEIVSGKSWKECKDDFVLVPPSPEMKRLCSGLFSFNHISVISFGLIDMVEGLVVGFVNCAKKRAMAKGAVLNFLGLGLVFSF
ncbi:hypothetical protein ACFX2I_019425 [Malus domestica]